MWTVHSVDEHFIATLNLFRYLQQISKHWEWCNTMSYQTMYLTFAMSIITARPNVPLHCQGTISQWHYLWLVCDFHVPAHTRAVMLQPMMLADDVSLDVPCIPNMDLSKCLVRLILRRIPSTRRFRSSFLRDCFPALLNKLLKFLPWIYT